MFSTLIFTGFRGLANMLSQTHKAIQKIWRLPEMGVPPVILHLRLGYSLLNHHHPAMGPHRNPLAAVLFILRLWRAVERVGKENGGQADGHKDHEVVPAGCSHGRGVGE